MALMLTYILAVLIWGTTWYAMIFQVAEVSAAASLTYRYLGAGLVLLILSAMAGRRVRLTGPEHLWCMIQGLVMYSFGYWLTYIVTEWLTTGIIALMFASTSAITMVMTAILTRRLPAGRAALGALMGVIGIGLVFSPEITRTSINGPESWASVLVAFAVVLFAAGGLIGARLQETMPPLTALGWPMLYGSLILALLTMARGEQFGFDWSVAYIGSLLYLMLFGSVAVFMLYFRVIEQIGAEKGSYATVIFPLVALGVSTVLEDYQWPALALIGVPLALAGNALVLMGRRSPAPAESAHGKAEAVKGLVAVEIEKPGRSAAE